MSGSPFAMPGCPNPRRVAGGSVFGNKLHGFAVTCMNSSSILLFAGQNDGTLHASSIDVPAGPAATTAERNILFADLYGRGHDDIIVSNGSAGTITILSSK
jgi:hypothetical protein